MFKIRHYYKKYKYLSSKKVKNCLFVIKLFVKRFFCNYKKLVGFTFLEIKDLCFKPVWKSFHNYKNLIVEIGSGHGELADFLSDNLENFVVSFEISKPFAKRVSNVLQSRKKENAVVIYGDAYHLIKLLFNRNSINKVYILFPDPWHKKKHHKRRPLTKAFFKIVDTLLVKDGKLIFVSDYPEYFDFVFKEFYFSKCKCDYLISLFDPERFKLPKTHYYKKWKKHGKTHFYYLELQKS